MSGRSYVDSGTGRVERLRRRLLGTAAAADLAATFTLLDDPARVRILHALSLDELCVSDLAALLGMSPSAVSHQLRLLRDRRLVAVRRDGRWSHYSLVDEHIRTLIDMAAAHVREGTRAAGRGGAR